MKYFHSVNIFIDFLLIRIEARHVTCDRLIKVNYTVFELKHMTIGHKLDLFCIDQSYTFIFII